MTQPILLGDKPWLPLKAIDWLEDNLPLNGRVFEWGAGGSTLWMAQRVKSVHSIEGDPAWIEAVLARARDLHLTNIDILNVPCVHDVGPFGEYSRVIDDYALMFDFILIDGCNGTRLACAHRAVTKVKPGGHIMLDNSGAAVHLAARDYLDGVYPLAERWVGPVYSPTPEGEGVTENSVWRAT